MSSLDVLFEPVRMGALTLPNRIVMATPTATSAPGRGLRIPCTGTSRGTVRRGAALNEIDANHIYGGDETGYNDYPSLSE